MSTRATIAAVVTFAIAMAYVEAACVSYLRQIYGIEGIVRDLPREADRFTAIEVGREAATIAMLAAVGAVSGRTFQARAGCFVLAFGAWDIAYYAWLALIEGWPRSPFDWDVLFLIPLPWWGPVLAPAAIAAVMCLGGAATVVQAGRGHTWRLTRTNVLVAAAGIATALYAFMADAIGALPDGTQAVNDVRPSDFQWVTFLAGFVLMSWAGLRVTWPGPSRFLRT